ncbi:pilus assembly protein [Pseudomonas sp. BCRC 81390]|uniref:TadE/TadG family type IV pilus assembly protein n=1 Tax=Pseudomonas sp. BCRC 81390 TaxID=3054778 RepID=UPI0025954E38|nr:TadE family protein [Pseudomonas sp. BCRC 81390]MDM3884999.1 pilus assembly protein [Pseudomonas sp. BCRC 81390]
MKRRGMRGVYVVEFAFVSVLLFTLLFGVLEMGRLYFTVNVLNESVRRGARLAAVCNISDPVVLRRAIFNSAGDSGASSLLADLDTGDLTLRYLDQNGALVASPGDLASASGFAAIRYVQLVLQNFQFSLFIPGIGASITLPAFKATLPRESLGRHPKADVAPEITPC